MQAGGERRHRDQVMNRWVCHDIQRLDEAARDQLLVVGEHHRPGAEEIFDDLGGLFGGGGTRVAQGREREAPGSELSEGPVGVHVATTHTSTTHQTDGETTHSHAPSHRADETFHRSATSSGIGAGLSSQMVSGAVSEARLREIGPVSSRPWSFSSRSTSGFPVISKMTVVKPC